MNKSRTQQIQDSSMYLFLAWMVALVAVGGSLYLSEIAGYVPCELCWVQRIFMYPLVIILGIAAYRGDRWIIPYVLPLTILGGCVSIYHYLEQQIDVPTACSQGAPCHAAYINWFGFVTIPFLALVGFVLMTIILWLGLKK